MILLLQQKDEAAFKELVMLYQHRVYHTVLGLLQNAADAEDTAQEVFIQVYKWVGQFRRDASLSTWIYRIAVTKALDFLRSKKTKTRFGFITAVFGNDNTPVYDPPNFDHPGVALDKKEDAALLFGLIKKLPLAQQAAFILNKLENLSYQEIAAVLNTSPAAVDSLLQRAKQNLKKVAAALGNNNPP